MRFKTLTSPHIHAPTSVTLVMVQVLVALVPGIAIYSYYFGWGVLINIAFTMLVALACEAVMLNIRKSPITPFLTDGSALVTAALLGVALPPLLPWWATLTAIAFAIVVAKHLYGGLGYNPFNPAMAGYALLLISFPREMTAWLAPQMLGQYHLGFNDTLMAIFTGRLPEGLSIDAFTMASPLDMLKTQIRLDQSVSEIMFTSPVFGVLSGKGWEWINAAFLSGGLWLMYRKIIGWQIPVGMLGAITLIALAFYVFDPEHHASPLFHLFSGASILGAFFIATDPVSAATTNPGRLIYGAGIGILTYVIRTWGGYPDGVAFAVLLMNMTAPTIDYYVKPRVFGHNKKS